MTLRQFACPHCHETFELDASVGGLTFACPHCAGAIALPSGPPVAQTAEKPEPPPVLSTVNEPSHTVLGCPNPFEPPVRSASLPNPFEPPVRSPREAPVWAAPAEPPNTAPSPFEPSTSITPEATLPEPVAPPRIEENGLAPPITGPSLAGASSVPPAPGPDHTAAVDPTASPTPGLLLRERAQRRLIKNLSLWVFCMIVLLLTLWYFLERGAQ